MKKINNLIEFIKYVKRKCAKDKTPIKEYLEMAKKAFPVEIKVYEEENE